MRSGLDPEARPPARRRFVGWRILALASLTGALTGPGQTIGVSVFVDHFIADLGLGRSRVSTAYLIGTVVAAFGLPVVGRQVDRLGVRKAMTAVGLAFGVALAAMSGVQGFVTLALGFVAIRLLGQGSLTLVSTVAITHWFERRRGTVLGAYATVVSVLMSLVPVGLGLTIESFGWRIAWWVAAVAIWFTVVPIARWGIIDRPSDVGQLPDGAIAGADLDPGRGRPPVGATRGQAVRTWRFWVLMSATASVGLLSTALNFHQISLLGDAGLTATEAAIMFLPQTIGAGVAGLGVGILTDRFTVRTLLPLSMGLLATALLLAANLTPGPVVVAYAVALGAAGGASRSIGAALLPRWFGVTHIGAIQGAATFMMVASTALGPVLFSTIHDVTGAYDRAALWFALLPLAVSFAALTVRPVPVPRREGDPGAGVGRPDR